MEARHALTPQEVEAMRKLSNAIYDRLHDTTDLSDTRLDALTQVALGAMERWLIEGN